jgi:hypothetical protein
MLKIWTLAILGSEHTYVRTDLQDTARGRVSLHNIWGI